MSNLTKQPNALVNQERYSELKCYREIYARRRFENNNRLAFSSLTRRTHFRITFEKYVFNNSISCDQSAAATDEFSWLQSIMHLTFTWSTAAVNKFGARLLRPSSSLDLSTKLLEQFAATDNVFWRLSVSNSSTSLLSHKSTNWFLPHRTDLRCTNAISHVNAGILEKATLMK